jgi:hypothetical protein
MKWMVLGLVALAGTASAQTQITPRSVETAFGLAAPFNNGAYRNEPAISSFAFPLLRSDDTPTTIRQREQRAEMVLNRYPELRAQLAQMPEGAARATIASLERKVRWELIREREAQR